MSDVTSLGTWVRRFLLEHLVEERNLARNTQRSYRDTLVVLIPFVAAKLNKVVDRLTAIDLSADVARLFLAHLEESRQCSIATRNQRLATRVYNGVGPHEVGIEPVWRSFSRLELTRRNHLCFEAIFREVLGVQSDNEVGLPSFSAEAERIVFWVRRKLNGGAHFDLLGALPN